MVETMASLASLKETPSIRAAALGGLAQRDLPRSAQLASRPWLKSRRMTWMCC